MSNITAIQQIVSDVEQAEEIKTQLELMKQTDNPEAEWEMKLLIEPEDLPLLLEEVTEVVEGDTNDA